MTESIVRSDGRRTFKADRAGRKATFGSADSYPLSGLLHWGGCGAPMGITRGTSLAKACRGSPEPAAATCT